MNTPGTDEFERSTPFSFEACTPAMRQLIKMYGDHARSLERRLRVYMDAVESAPHDISCPAVRVMRVGHYTHYVMELAAGECNCWKSRIAAELAKEW